MFQEAKKHTAKLKIVLSNEKVELICLEGFLYDNYVISGIIKLVINCLKIFKSYNIQYKPQLNQWTTSKDDRCV